MSQVNSGPHQKMRSWGTSGVRCPWSRRTWGRRAQPVGFSSALTWWCLRSGAVEPIALAYPGLDKGWHGVKLVCKCVFKLIVKCQKAGVTGRERLKKSVSMNKLTVNSPVTASKPTCMVCSKSEGGEISGRSLSRSFFRPPERNQNLIRFTQRQKNDFIQFPTKLFLSPFSAPEKIEMILLRGFLSSGTDGRGLELWLAESESLLEPVLKMVLLILTGGAGGLSSGSPLSHIAIGCSLLGA